MPQASEREMYRPVRARHEGFLVDRHRGCVVRVLDGSRTSLARLVDREGLAEGLAPEWPSWDMKVDVVGFAIGEGGTHWAFVECKPNAVNLRALSQPLGYSRVARPVYSFIVAPHGASDALRSLLLTFSRLDVLRYREEAGQLPWSIVVARWDSTRGCIDTGSMITGDRGRIGRL